MQQRNPMPLLRRGELATSVGCNLETVRYYEGIGLLPHPPRSQGRHRLYDADLVKRLRFILRGRELGFSIEEIRALLAIADGAGGCADVYALTTQHLDVVKRKIADLRKLQRILSETAAHCARDASPDCPIIEAMSAPPRAPQRRH
ncbi:MAG: helix-turn-helix domain-containing protein [Sphingopyxis sp.]|nr:helix-turn-helix domain-containing protein [Sphingopyxis sp.]MCW0198597.1 helix-turn-helix domain-containing protein [Sphingopyxis sp.]